MACVCCLDSYHAFAAKEWELYQNKFCFEYPVFYHGVVFHLLDSKRSPRRYICSFICRAGDVGLLDAACRTIPFCGNRVRTFLCADERNAESSGGTQHLVERIRFISRRVGYCFCGDVYRYRNFVSHHHRHSQRKSIGGRFIILRNDDASAWSVHRAHGGNRPIALVEELRHGIASQKSPLSYTLCPPLHSRDLFYGRPSSSDADLYLCLCFCPFYQCSRWV